MEDKKKEFWKNAGVFALCAVLGGAISVSIGLTIRQSRTVETVAPESVINGELQLIQDGDTPTQDAPYLTVSELSPNGVYGLGNSTIGGGIIVSKSEDTGTKTVQEQIWDQVIYGDSQIYTVTLELKSPSGTYSTPIKVASGASVSAKAPTANPNVSTTLTIAGVDFSIADNYEDVIFVGWKNGTTTLTSTATTITGNTTLSVNSVDNNWYTYGTYVSGGVYNINNVDEFYEFAAVVNGDTTGMPTDVTARDDFKDKTVNLLTDIDLNPGKTINATTVADSTFANSLNKWTPIGHYVSATDDQRFAGTFDGKYHKVLGMYINASASNQGLFSGTIAGAIVQNIGVENNYVKSSGSNITGIVGSNSGTVKNCYNAGYIVSTVSYWAGYIAGVCRGGTAECCYNSGVVTASNAAWVGGVVITNANYCYNIGTVTGRCGVGGISGVYGSQSYCYNTGKIIATTTDRVCGITGSTDGVVKNCYFFKSSTINSGLGYNGDSSGTVTGCGTFNGDTTDWDSIYSAINTKIMVDGVETNIWEPYSGDPTRPFHLYWEKYFER